LPRALSNLVLNVSRDGALTSSLGNLGQGYTTLCEEKKKKSLPCIQFVSTLP